MPDWLHRTDKRLLRSVAAADLPEPSANFIEQPNLSAVLGQPPKYWVIAGDVVSLADAATRAAIDTAELTAHRDRLADEMTALETYSRNFALIVLDEFNSVSSTINSILTQISSATSLADLRSRIQAITPRPQRTAAQLKTALRNRMNT